MEEGRSGGFLVPLVSLSPPKAQHKCFVWRKMLFVCVRDNNVLCVLCFLKVFSGGFEVLSLHV